MLSDSLILFIQESAKYFELIATITGTVYFYKYKYSYLKYFLYLLWFTTFTEFIGPYAIEKEFLIFFDEKGIKYNLWMYNLLEIITFMTFFYMYFKSIKNSSYRLWIKIFIISYVVISVFNWAFIQSFILEWSELPYIVGSLFLIITILFYFIELLKSEKILLFHRTLLFWISVGLLLFYTGTIPFTIEMNGYALIPGTHKLFLIMYILAIVMYLIFTFGFIWSKKE